MYRYYCESIRLMRLVTPAWTYYKYLYPSPLRGSDLTVAAPLCLVPDRGWSWYL